MPILERLKREVPRNRRGVRVDHFYELTKKFVKEIEEARQYGYSWVQICVAIQSECEVQGKWNKNWRALDIQSNYYKIKKEKT